MVDHQDAPPTPPVLSLDKIKDLLKSKDDTQRFVGLAFTKSLLDNSQQHRQDEQVIQELWTSLSPRFLNRLLRTGSRPDASDGKQMLDLAASVMHTFAALLPQSSMAEAKFTERIPAIIDALLYSSGETTQLLLQLLHGLVSNSNGARALVQVDDVSPLTELAPSHALVLTIISFAWLNAMAGQDDMAALAPKLDSTLQGLVSSFVGTDAVTLLDFVASFLRQVDASMLRAQPKWLKTIVGYIHNLVSSRPAPEARAAYTNATASLLQTYPSDAPSLLFADDKERGKPWGYLVVNLVLIDIRSSAPSLLEQLNGPQYADTSRRLASAFDIMSIFIGYLVRCLEDESLDALFMSPDNLLKLRNAMTDTMSVTIDYLRDRWDASVAGALGLHPDARTAKTETWTGSHRTLPWDSLTDSASNDALMLAALRALALWLREDDNDVLRKQASGLMDMLVHLYRQDGLAKLDFKSPVLVACEALVTIRQGREQFLANDGWQALSKDLTAVMQACSGVNDQDSASRGTDMVRLLSYVVQEETGGVAEDWMDLVTHVAAWNLTPQASSPLAVQEFQVAVLQLCCTLLVKARLGMRTRYRHSISAIRGIASQLSSSIQSKGPVGDAMQHVQTTLDGLAVGVPPEFR
ncbi:hypothetical protein CDD81_6941 [Ophiocordyceps australis]|uniref:DUF1941 family protein n=1 Tax=Ophiocordyceps australis TaxID=1399860 RepID=A0A2C5XZ74_9HYPO|nr:hypothetical protein CDD81_6941 [Ophiocordyceps australis]